MVYRSQKLPVPPDPASPPSSSTDKAEANNPPAILQLFEWVNLSTARRAQDLVAMRSLCVGGDASRSWASVIEDYLEKVTDKCEWHGHLLGRFETEWHETERS